MSDVTVRLPVVLSVMVHRQDPKRPGVINFRSLAACAMAAKSWTSCTDPEQSSAKPVWRQAMTSE